MEEQPRFNVALYASRFEGLTQEETLRLFHNLKEAWEWAHPRKEEK